MKRVPGYRLGGKVLAGVLAAAIVGVPQVAQAEPAAVNPPADSEVTPFEALRVMPLGDSITRGTGTTTLNGYRAALAHRLFLGGMKINYVGSQSNGTGSDTQHEGHGGYNIDELSAGLDDWLAQARPDIVLLHAGTNTIKEGEGAYAAADKLSALIDQIRVARPQAYIFVAQVISSRVPEELADDRAYNRLIPPMVAAKNDPLITVVNQSTVGGIDLHDLRHPNEFGYSKMAYNWYTAMARVFQLSGDTGANPYRATSARRCMSVKTYVKGEEQHRTECLVWHLRTTNGKRTWQTLRTAKQSYRVRVNGKTQTRTRLVKKWTGPGNLLNV
ncbi:SGNH/GDSL hydrolase family protein [Actinoplanes sp. NPDC026623]|uniref:SGNH/GDSL hydrolase family protein n=1 Tax=Actinoplanes sp. NPDC026623 TaxID=3155610 RepID=UPI0033CD9F9A